MCGIAGIFKLDEEPWENIPGELSQMLAAMNHRGPDARGSWIDGPIALGVNRLSIVDPVSRSDQPMTSQDGRYTIAFNGEIYNYRELRQQLRERGHHFVTGSDTEVLLRLYAEEKEKCLSKLRGMFAFAVWDKLKREIFLARDRLGEKPLVYYRDDKIFAFSSDLPSLLSLSCIPRKIDGAGLVTALNFMHAIAPRTAFHNIRKLVPAHFLKISKQGISTQRYWQCDFSSIEQFHDEQECVEEIVRCFDETVSLMSRCHVPVGALLSGGLDSSSVVAAMARELENFPTFRIGYSSGKTSSLERQSAATVSELYGTNHFEYPVQPGNFRVLEEIVRHHGEPVATGVPISAYLVSRKMQDHVKVALCGAGGDELFGGYHEHQFLYILDTYVSQAKKWQLSPTKTPVFQSEPEEVAWRFYQQFNVDQPEKIFASYKYNDLPLKQKAFTPAMQQLCIEHHPLRYCVADYLSCNADSLVNGFFNQQITTISQYSIADLNDRMGMAHSIEIRSPFLDVEMVELAMRIPAHLKTSLALHGTSTKNILRKAMAARLPSFTLQLGKIGFGATVPIDQWLQDDCSQFVEEKLQSEALADSGLFDLAGIQELYTLYQCGAAINNDFFIGLASTAIWLEEFF